MPLRAFLSSDPISCFFGKNLLKQPPVSDILRVFPGGVTVAQEFLVLLVQVRILAGDFQRRRPIGRLLSF